MLLANHTVVLVRIILHVTHVLMLLDNLPQLVAVYLTISKMGNPLVWLVIQNVLLVLELGLAILVLTVPGVQHQDATVYRVTMKMGQILVNNVDTLVLLVLMELIAILVQEE